ncbi:MAG: rhodanese-like domain-containing protein [Oscillospiraceae bacterium]|nr:rhodanese-like domain-containing protein [Oscillospiraceae bacterium]
MTRDRKEIKMNLFLLGAALLLLAGCALKKASAPQGPAESAAPKPSYRQIDQETAKKMMAADDGHVIVDVRRQDEYDAGHIPGAILIPNESIGTEPPAELPDLEQVILIYCRSGNRSRQASQKLADMGYVNVYEFGGIIDWTGEVVTEEQAPAAP